jgi:hypothetical protein
MSSSTYRVFVPIDATFVNITVVSNEKPEKSSGLAMKCLASTTPHASLPCVPPVMKTRLIFVALGALHADAEPENDIEIVRIHDAARARAKADTLFMLAYLSARFFSTKQCLYLPHHPPFTPRSGENAGC